MKYFTVELRLYKCTSKVWNAFGNKTKNINGFENSYKNDYPNDWDEGLDILISNSILIRTLDGGFNFN